jgi:hypothetical protein
MPIAGKHLQERKSYFLHLLYRTVEGAGRFGPVLREVGTGIRLYSFQLHRMYSHLQTEPVERAGYFYSRVAENIPEVPSRIREA